jgi:uncharacterized protein YdeI (YjbR/CyaY-like superfamily)
LTKIWTWPRLVAHWRELAQKAFGAHGIAKMIEGLAFSTPEDWAAWLSDHHAIEDEVWVLIYKKPSGNASIDWQEAVIEALAWGWIDGVKKSVSDTQWAQRFTPRRAGSAWSKINRTHAEQLINSGRMRQAGLRHVTVARENGRWESAFVGNTAEMPQDFLDALAQGPKAAQLEYASLNARNRYAIFYRITTAKRPETREKRINEYIAMLARGETLL